MITNEQNKEITKYLLSKNLRIDLILEVKDEGDGIILSNQTFDSDDADTLLRDRKRGFPLLIEMAYHVDVAGNQVKVILDLDQEEIEHGTNH